MVITIAGSVVGDAVYRYKNVFDKYHDHVEGIIRRTCGFVVKPLHKSPLIRLGNTIIPATLNLEPEALNPKP